MPGFRVLIVDDDSLVALLIEEELRLAGFSVIGKACSGEEAVALAVELCPDVVLMDVKMPGMGGVEATREIQKRCPAPVVLLTAHDLRTAAALAAEAGAAAYLTKSAIRAELLATLRSVCRPTTGE